MSALPSADASATAEPDTPPKNSEPSTLTCESPPFIQPTSMRVKFIRYSPNRPDIIRSPARMKNGMASIGNCEVGL